MDVHIGHGRGGVRVSIVLEDVKVSGQRKGTHHNEPQEHEHCCYAIHGVAEELLPIDDT